MKHDVRALLAQMREQGVVSDDAREGVQIHDVVRDVEVRHRVVAEDRSVCGIGRQQERVGSGAAGQRVVAGETGQPVVARVACERVRKSRANHTLYADERVGSATTVCRGPDSEIHGNCA